MNVYNYCAQISLYTKDILTIFDDKTPKTTLKAPLGHDF